MIMLVEVVWSAMRRGKHFEDSSLGSEMADPLTHG
jgi:hypothetical protein